jgi:hypothetical protein
MQFLLSSEFRLHVYYSVMSHFMCVTHKNIHLNLITLNRPSIPLSMLIKNRNNNKVLKYVFHNTV